MRSEEPVPTSEIGNDDENGFVTTEEPKAEVNTAPAQSMRVIGLKLITRHKATLDKLAKAT